MPMTYERLPDEHIVIFSFAGNVTVEEQREMYQISAGILDETGRHLYRLSNYSFVTSSFAEVLGIVRDLGGALPGSIADPRITAVIVGAHQWTKLAADMAKRPQFGSVQIPIFSTVEDGLVALRLVMREVARARDLGDQWA
jgi:hypothetical protein